jgi:hypothetical protein
VMTVVLDMASSLWSCGRVGLGDTRLGSIGLLERVVGRPGCRECVS